MAGNKNVVMLIAVIFTFIVVISATTDDPKRQLITTINPGCSEGNNCSCGPGVAYIKAVGQTDILHFVMSAIGGPPTILLIRTDKPKHGDLSEDSLHIDCPKLLDHGQKAITLPAALKELYSFGFVFTRLFQYNDTTDKADMSRYNINSTAWRVYDLIDFDWVSLADTSSDFLIQLKVDNSKDMEGLPIANGSLILQFHMFDHMDRTEALPHLQYTENTTQFDLILQNIDTGNSTAARWAVETVMLSGDSEKSSMKTHSAKSIDDEYSPGVFTISNWYTKAGDIPNGGFLQWKPICYLKSSRDRADGTPVKQYTMTNTKYVDDFLSRSIVASYYEDFRNILRAASNFSFGLEDDGGFTKTSYTAWTAQLGFGEPPQDKISTLVIVVISAGLGLPVVIILFGGLFIFIKKKMSGGSNYEKLNGVDNKTPAIQ